MNRKARLAALAIIALGAPALAQPGPDERVIVTAPRLVPDRVIEDYVRSHAAPTQTIGKIARWHNGVCPAVTGLPKRSADFLVRRIREIAVHVGAPLPAKDACNPNIQIVFTTQPQALLDNIRAQHPGLLGAYEIPLSRAAMVRFPIQAWYATATEDLRGMRTDDGPPRGPGMALYITDGSGSLTTLYLPNAHAEAVEQGRLGNGLRSEIYNAIIVVDPGKLADLEMGSLADYIAMLALSQSQSGDACQDVASITNLLSPACDPSRKPDAITDLDLAYLGGLYKMDSAGTLQQEQSDIAYRMKEGLKVR